MIKDMTQPEALAIIADACSRLSAKDAKPKSIVLPTPWKQFFGEGPVFGCSVQYHDVYSACTVSSVDNDEDPSAQVIQVVWLLPDHMTGRDKVREVLKNRPQY